MNKVAGPLAWTPALATGVVEIDNQHQQIFRWFDELASAAAAERMTTTLFALGQLEIYSTTHFAIEEAMMARNGYPHVANHRAQHDSFRARVKELRASAANRDISVATIELLRDWLARHIMQVDMDYLPWVQGTA